MAPICEISTLQPSGVHAHKCVHELFLSTVFCRLNACSRAIVVQGSTRTCTLTEGVLLSVATPRCSYLLLCLLSSRLSCFALALNCSDISASIARTLATFCSFVSHHSMYPHGACNLHLYASPPPSAYSPHIKGMM